MSTAQSSPSLLSLRIHNRNVKCHNSTVNRTKKNRTSISFATFFVWWMTVLLDGMMMMSSTSTSTSTDALSWSAHWMKLKIKNSIVPSRSGHVAFGLDNDKTVYVFGGYAEEENSNDGPIVRYPTNDLWKLDLTTAASAAATTTTSTSVNSDQEVKWELVQPNDESHSIQPQARLAAAAVTVTIGDSSSAPSSSSSSSFGLILGGWDSQQAGTGGVILQDMHLYGCLADDDEGNDNNGRDDDDNRVWKQLETDLQQPTSRLCAVTLDGGTRVLVHNHRCTGHVLLLDFNGNNNANDDSQRLEPTLTVQPTSGIGPSPRGLHSMTRLMGNNQNLIVLFGGAAQDGTMSNEVFVLDTDTWEWTTVECVDDDNVTNPSNNIPTPRASPCLVSLDDTTCIVFGGASRIPPSEGNGLHGCSDTWLLELVPHAEGDSDNDGNSDNHDGKGSVLNKKVSWKVRWTQLYPDLKEEDEDSSGRQHVSPPGRNAATLTPITPLRKGVLLHGDDTNDGDDDKVAVDNDDDDYTSTQYFLLSGGWYPFRITYNDNFVLKVTKTKTTK